jgi:exodeoxyribonuclease VIII
MLNLVYDESFEQYRAAEGLNKSGIDKLLLCPAEYRAMLDTPAEPTPAMKFGTMFHCRVLQSSEYVRSYHVLSADPRTKDGKAEKAKAEEDGLTVISMPDFEKASRMLQNLHAHPRIDALLSRLPGDAEVSVYWEQDVDGDKVQAKARMDRLAILPSGEVIAVDLKTTSGGLTTEDISRHVAQFRYHRQSAWYVHGLAAQGLAVNAFVFVFVQTAAPFLCRAVTLDAEAEALGLRECEMAARIFRNCKRDDAWPSYAEDVKEIGLPLWYDRISPAASAMPTSY